MLIQKLQKMKKQAQFCRILPSSLLAETRDLTCNKLSYETKKPILPQKPKKEKKKKKEFHKIIADEQ